MSPYNKLAQALLHRLKVGRYIDIGEAYIEMIKTMYKGKRICRLVISARCLKPAITELFSLVFYCLEGNAKIEGIQNLLLKSFEFLSFPDFTSEQNDCSYEHLRNELKVAAMAYQHGLAARCYEHGVRLNHTPSFP
jgi:hypothetical protein